VLEAFNLIVKADAFYGLHLFDRVKVPKETDPVGYYIGCSGIFKEKFWKIDIWFMSQDHKQSVELMQSIKEKITDEKRLVILELKTYRDENNLPISGKDIYEGVLNANITNVTELEEYLRKIVIH
jgi:hypothetical protein